MSIYVQHPDHVKTRSVSEYDVLEVEIQKFLFGRVEPEPGKMRFGGHEFCLEEVVDVCVFWMLGYLESSFVRYL